MKTEMPSDRPATVKFTRADGSGPIHVRLDMISSWEKDKDGFGSKVWLIDGVTNYHVTESTKWIQKFFKPTHP